MSLRASKSQPLWIVVLEQNFVLLVQLDGKGQLDGKRVASNRVGSAGAPLS